MRGTVAEAVSVIYRFHSGNDFFRIHVNLSDINELWNQSCEFRFSKAGIFIKIRIRSYVKGDIKSGSQGIQ